MGVRGLGQGSTRQSAGRQVLGDLELCRHIERLGHTVPVTELKNGFGWSVLSSVRHLLIPFGCVNRSQSAERVSQARLKAGADAGGSQVQRTQRDPGRPSTAVRGARPSPLAPLQGALEGWSAPRGGAPFPTLAAGGVPCWARAGWTAPQPCSGSTRPVTTGCTP